jgi:hypothetical protein
MPFRNGNCRSETVTAVQGGTACRSGTVTAVPNNGMRHQHGPPPRYNFKKVLPTVPTCFDKAKFKLQPHHPFKSNPLLNLNLKFDSNVDNDH